ncbi:MAG: cation-efflux pump, partial [Gaiellaceae bacterium]
MSPQRRTALVSVGAACLLVAIKLVAGLASSSLGLLAEAAHSGTDLAAALLTFFAVSVAVRPADRGHPWGHGKAQNLAALAEAGFLILVSVGIAVAAILRLAGVVKFEVEPTAWTFAAIALVLAIDASRTVVSLRGARLYSSDALLANALHFGSDFAGTIAVLAGLIAASVGFPAGDSIAALFVSGLVVAAATRLAGRNVDVLMDRSPEDDTRIARQAIARLQPPVELRRLRLRRAGGEHFADVVIGVAPGAAIGQGHAAADRVEQALHDALPGIDVVVHVEPQAGETAIRERVLAAALTVSHVREIHNLTVLDVDGSIEVSLHVKLPGHLSLVQAHEIAEQVEAAIVAQVPEVESA